MSVRCEHCGATAGYGQEVGHKSDCPTLRRDFTTLRRMTPSEIKGVRDQMPPADQETIERRVTRNDKTMTLNLPEREMAALEALAAEKEMSKTAIMRQALRLYQLVNIRLNAGEQMIFSGDDQRRVEFIGL